MDAIYHMIIMATLAAIALFLFGRNKKTWAIIIALPWLTELAQISIPNHGFEFMDIFHDYLGVVSVLLVIRAWDELTGKNIKGFTPGNMVNLQKSYHKHVNKTNNPKGDKQWH